MKCLRHREGNPGHCSYMPYMSDSLGSYNTMTNVDCFILYLSKSLCTCIPRLVGFGYNDKEVFGKQWQW